MEYCGHGEKSGQTKAVDPCRGGLPLVIRQEVQEGTAKDAGNYPQLARDTAKILSKTLPIN